MWYWQSLWHLEKSVSLLVSQSWVGHTCGSRCILAEAVNNECGAMTQIYVRWDLGLCVNTSENCSSRRRCHFYDSSQKNLTDPRVTLDMVNNVCGLNSTDFRTAGLDANCSQIIFYNLISFVLIIIIIIICLNTGFLFISLSLFF